MIGHATLSSDGGGTSGVNKATLLGQLRIEREDERPRRPRRPRGGGGPWLMIIAAVLVVALLAAWADFKLANSARTAAARIQREIGAASHAVWFEGHWGFQYYIQMRGAKPVDFLHMDFSPGDAIILPEENSRVFNLSQTNVESWYEHDFSSSKWLTTMNGSSGAGFYSDIWGPLPFVFCQVPVDHYLILRAK